MVELAHGFDGLQALDWSHAAPFGAFRFLPFLVRGEDGHDFLKSGLLLHGREHTTAREN
jgi:hypothetical protein